MGSTGFLVGPLRQLKSMFAKKRIIATAVYVVSMAMTLFVAFYVSSLSSFHIGSKLTGLKISNEKKGLRTGLVIMLLIIQWCALIW